VLLWGAGGNGKSTLLGLLRALLGAENVAAVSLHDLEGDRFAKADLVGKLATICGDLDLRAIRSSDSFKQLTGGDLLRVQRKHGQPFTFMPIAVPIFSANGFAPVADQSPAWFDRWLVLPFERRFVGDDPARPFTAFRRALQRSAVKNHGTRLSRAVLPEANQFTQISDDGLEDLRLDPAARLLVDRGPRWQIVRHKAPLESGPRNVAESIEELAQGMFPLRRILAHQCQVGSKKRPFIIRNIRRVAGARCRIHTQNGTTTDIQSA
jgi:hypothetical protein